jgi:ferredoxin
VKVAVDRSLCVGHGRCYDLCPEVFGEDEEGYCVVVQPEVPAAHRARARRAADNCPEHAIAVED